MKFSFMQNPLTQIPFFAWIYNSFINSHLLEWLKVRQIKSGIRVNFDQCDVCIDLSDTSIEIIEKSKFNLHGFTSGLEIS